MDTFGATLAALLMLAGQTKVVVNTQREARPEYHQTEYESACGPTVFRVRFRNGVRESGRVDHVLINDQPVRDAARTLQIRAARRVIASFEIMDCGMDPIRPVFRGVMVLSEGESRAAGMPHLLFFRLSRRDKEWQIIPD